MIELIQAYPERSAMTLVIVLLALAFLFVESNELLSWFSRLAVIAALFWALVVMWNLS